MGDQMERRFGFIAIHKRFITAKQLIQAVTIQLYEEVDRGQRRLIGEILVDMGAMTQEQCDEVLAELESKHSNG